MKQIAKIPVSYPDFYLIGIASHENDYRLAWAINASLGIALSKISDVVVYHDKYKHDIPLSVFAQDMPEQGYSIKMFANRGDNFFLLEEFRNIDFFLKIEGEVSESKIQSFTASLKKIEIIMGVYKMDTNIIKKIQRLHF